MAGANGLAAVCQALIARMPQAIPGTPQSLPGDPIDNWEYSGTFTKIVGAHTITAGASLIHTWVLDNCTYASATFNNLPTSDPQNAANTGSGRAKLSPWFTDCRDGVADGTAEQRLHGNYYGTFVDDVWKATSRLTVDLA